MLVGHIHAATRCITGLGVHAVLGFEVARALLGTLGRLRTAEEEGRRFECFPT